MARVISDEVLEIVETSLSDISPFIATATLMVDNWLEDSSLSAATLKEIEKYLVAHILSVRDPRIKSYTLDVLRETYQGEWGKGLNGTSYGQMCILLDTTGTLSKLTRKGKQAVSFGVIDYHED